MTQDEIHKFASDTPGKLKTPAPGTETTREDQQSWLGHNRLYAEYLTKQKYCDAVAETFHTLFSERLDKQATTEWATVGLFDLLKAIMAKSAIVSLSGFKIMDINPGFL
jgi:hypothetical protein